MRDIRVAFRVGGGALIGVLFFLAVVTLIPFALGPDLALLRRIGPAILWLGALLASLLTLDRLFADDHADGSLDLLLMGRAPLELVVAAKAVAHWLDHGTTARNRVTGTGSYAQSRTWRAGCRDADVARRDAGAHLYRTDRRALAVTVRRGGLLLPILILPLTIPVLIFGVSAANAALTGPVSFGTPFTVLCALTLFSIVIGPFAAAATLRHGLE